MTSEGCSIDKEVAESGGTFVGETAESGGGTIGRCGISSGKTRLKSDLPPISVDLLN